MYGVLCMLGVPIHMHGLFSAWAECVAFHMAYKQLHAHHTVHSAHQSHTDKPTCARSPTTHSSQGHVVLEGSRSKSNGSSGSGAAAAAPAPVPLHHCVWMAMELLGDDLWTAKEEGRAFARPDEPFLIEAGKSALKVGFGWGYGACACTNMYAVQDTPCSIVWSCWF